MLVATQHGCLACRRVELANFEFSSNGVIDVARTTSDLPTTLPVDIPGVLDPDTNGVSMVHCEALIDSGASHSLIDPQLAERLNPTCLTGHLTTGQARRWTGGRSHVILQVSDGGWVPCTLLSWNAKLNWPVIIGSDFLAQNQGQLTWDASRKPSLRYNVPQNIDPTIWAEGVNEEDDEKPERYEPGDQIMTYNQAMFIYAFQQVERQEKEAAKSLPNGSDNNQTNTTQGPFLRSPVLGGELAEIVTLEELDAAVEQQALDRLAEPWKEKIFDEFGDNVFSPDPCDFHNREAHRVGDNLIQHDIQLKPDAEPFQSRVIRQGPAATREMVRMLRDFQNRGLFYKCQSRYTSPCFLVKKKSGKFRLVSNFQKLNSMTLTYPTHIPLIQDVLHSLSNGAILSSMDISDSFFIVRNSPRAEKYSAIETPIGVLCPTRMQQGLCGSPWTLQRLISAIFEKETFGTKQEPEGWLSTYFDDVTVRTSGPPTIEGSVQEHYEKLRGVLLKMKKHGIPLNPAKSQLFKLNIEILGYLAGQGKVRMDRKKVQTILDMEPPTNVPEVRRLMGLVQHNRTFIRGLAKFTAPIAKLTGKSGFEWNDECSEAFSKLKRALVSAPLLHMPRGHGSYELETDASDTHCGGSLYQFQTNPETGETERNLIGNFSRKLSPQQQTWSTHKQELLAIVQACEHYDHLLRFSPGLELFTDSEAAKTLLTKEQTQENDISESRLRNRLNVYRSIIHYRKGENNKAADFLSRPPGSDSYILRVLDCAAGLGSTLIAFERLAEKGLLRQVKGLSYTAVERNKYARDAIMMNYEKDM